MLSCHKQQSPCDLHDSFPQQVEQALLALEVMEAEMSEPLGVTLVDATLSQLGLAVPSESDILSDTIQLSASSIALPTGGACEVLCVPIDAPSLCVAERLALVVALEHALRISVLAGCSGSSFLLVGSAFRRVDIACSSMGVPPPELEYIFSSALYRRYLSLSGIELRGPVGPQPVLVNLPYLGGGLLFHVGQGQCSISSRFQSELRDSSVDHGGDRLGWLCSSMPGLIVSDNISWRLVASNAPQLVSGYSCDSLSVDGELWGGMSGAPRQWLSMIALVSPADCCVIRKELVQYDSGCDFTRVPSSESPKFFFLQTWFFSAQVAFSCSTLVRGSVLRPDSGCR